MAPGLKISCDQQLLLESDPLLSGMLALQWTSDPQCAPVVRAVSGLLVTSWLLNCTRRSSSPSPAREGSTRFLKVLRTVLLIPEGFCWQWKLFRHAVLSTDGPQSHRQHRVSLSPKAMTRDGSGRKRTVQCGLCQGVEGEWQGVLQLLCYCSENIQKGDKIWGFGTWGQEAAGDLKVKHGCGHREISRPRRWSTSTKLMTQTREGNEGGDGLSMWNSEVMGSRAKCCDSRATSSVWSHTTSQCTEHRLCSMMLANPHLTDLKRSTHSINKYLWRI